MVEQTPHYRPYDPDVGGYDENLTDHPVTPYRFGHSARTDFHREDFPIFAAMTRLQHNGFASKELVAVRFQFGDRDIGVKEGWNFAEQFLP